MGRKRYSEELASKVRWYYLNTGMSMRQVAKHFGISDTTVSKILARKDVKPMTDERLKELNRLHQLMETITNKINRLESDDEAIDGSRPLFGVNYVSVYLENGGNCELRKYTFEDPGRGERILQKIRDYAHKMLKDELIRIEAKYKLM